MFAFFLLFLPYFFKPFIFNKNYQKLTFHNFTFLQFLYFFTKVKNFKITLPLYFTKKNHRNKKKQKIKKNVFLKKAFFQKTYFCQKNQNIKKHYF